MSPVRAALVLVLAALLLPALSACSGSTATGTSYTVTPLREIEAYLPGPIARVHEAAVETLGDDLGYEITTNRQDALEGIVKARTARNSEARVETFRESDKITKVQVRVGALGDEQQARAILQAIERRVRGG